LKHLFLVIKVIVVGHESIWSSSSSSVPVLLVEFLLSAYSTIKRKLLLELIINTTCIISIKLRSMFVISVHVFEDVLSIIIFRIAGTLVSLNIISIAVIFLRFISVLPGIVALIIASVVLGEQDVLVASVCV
jgi:hypothetical protein